MTKTFKDYLKEAENESGLEYYKGVKKHGKEYMDKAAKAGREGASQEELGRLKDKYSKAEKNKNNENIDEAYMQGYQNYHCKDCGDIMHKPTTDCPHDPHDENGRHWVDDNGNGIHDMDEADMQRGMGSLDKFRELYNKGIGSDDAEFVLRELIDVINDDALSNDFPQLQSFTSKSEFDDSEIVTAKSVPGDSADEKIMSLVKAIDDDSWVDEFAQHLMQKNSMTDNEELNRIKQLSGATVGTNIDETYDDDDDFYNAYGEMWYNDDDIVDEAEYQGRKVKLGKPMAGDVKKFKVYVKDPKTGNVKKVNFGHGGSSVKGKSMRIRKNNPGARKSFRARHNCDNPGPRTKARYWSCRKW